MEATNRMFGMIGMICKFGLSSFLSCKRKLARPRAQGEDVRRRPVANLAPGRRTVVWASLFFFFLSENNFFFRLPVRLQPNAKKMHDQIEYIRRQQEVWKKKKKSPLASNKENASAVLRHPPHFRRQITFLDTKKLIGK